MGNEFESDSNSFNIKIQGSIKAVSQKEEEMFKEKESELFYEI